MLELVDPELTIGAMTDRIAGIALRPPGLWWWVAFVPAALLTLLLAVSMVWLFVSGIGIWGVDWPVMWGFALIGYVWWIAIASGGTFISALFYLAGVQWRTALNRIAETMTLCAAACAGLYPILHLGRPWLFYWLFPYDNTMGLWPQFKSPLLWDFFAILAYVLTSILFWYFGLLPDLATMRDRAPTRPRQLLYGILALGFRGSGEQWRHYQAAYGVLAAVMAPLVVSVHSIVGLDFAGAATVGWHSTQFPPFFVFGALLSGFATVLLLAIGMRTFLGLTDVITPRHLDVLARMLLVSSLLVGYAYLQDAFEAGYTADAAVRAGFLSRLRDGNGVIYGATLLCNVLLVQGMWWRRLRRSTLALTLVSLAVIAGMWCERYTIVVMSLEHTRLPSAFGHFRGTFWDWSTLLGTLGLFATGLLLAVRYLPCVSMFEMRRLLPSIRPGASHMDEPTPGQPAGAARPGAAGALVAVFDTSHALCAALARLREQGFQDARTYTPMPLGRRGASPLPLVVLAGGLLGAAAAFAMQVYANVWSYPLDIGGRPELAWPSYVPIAFEVGALCAVLCGVLGYCIVNRLPALYEPIDELPALREVTRDGWAVAVCAQGDRARQRAWQLLTQAHPRALGTVPA